jgi:hypothetical protein
MGMSYSIFEPASVEGRRKLVARQLAARAVRMNQFDSPPRFEGHEHDELESGQEEVTSRSGETACFASAATVPLAAGRYVLVTPDESRQVIAGPDGLSYLVVGAVIG